MRASKLLSHAHAHYIIVIPIILAEYVGVLHRHRFHSLILHENTAILCSQTLIRAQMWFSRGFELLLSLSLIASSTNIALTYELW